MAKIEGNDEILLKVALPNKGSLAKGAIELMSAAGYKCKRRSKELVCYDKDSKVEFIFLRPKDIATYINAGIFDFGITGRDIAQDNHFELDEVLALNFGKSKMHYIIPQEQSFKGIEQFNNKRIACSYPTLLKKHLDKENIKADIIKLEGAVEIAIHLDIADVIVDVVETGTTIKEAGLKCVGNPIIKSEAILIGKDNKSLQNDKNQALNPKDLAFSQMCNRLKGIVVARNYVMIEYDVKNIDLEKACKICEGLQSPTVTPLKEEGWFAVKVAAEASKENDILDKLIALNAKGIIVTPVKNCRII